jgi:hypothetical protein
VIVNMHGRTTIKILLYSCDIWSFPLREDRRLGVYENRRLRKIFGPQTDVVTRDWRRLHSEKLYDLYCSLNTFRVNKT